MRGVVISFVEYIFNDHLIVVMYVVFRPRWCIGIGIGIGIGRRVKDIIYC